jgi:hypothetical protein
MVKFLYYVFDLVKFKIQSGSVKDFSKKKKINISRRCSTNSHPISPRSILILSSYAHPVP